MAVSEQLKKHIIEQLSQLGPIRHRNMFGGVGLYFEELFFGLIVEDGLFLKVDETNRHDFEAVGMAQFIPFKDRPTKMNFYQIPEEVLEDVKELRVWVNKSLEVAVRARGSKIS
ncbi:MAG TPA: competence protein TfoX [Gammaproteobacteria bacterium]|nr:competence protein TfoX [Gammaproteobacteria bacterium]